jgi:hypothetical protein
MRNKVILFFVLLFATIYSCTSKISDRIHPLKDASNDFKIDTFQVYKKVKIDLELVSRFDFGNKNIMILINSSERVFYGTYKDLLESKIGLPKPTEYSKNGSAYLIAVFIIDEEEKLIYKWASDESNYLSTKKKNIIELLYTGVPDESITLRVR